MAAKEPFASVRARLRTVRLARLKIPEDPGAALVEAVTCGEAAKDAAAHGQWKRALSLCRQIARLHRLFPEDRLLAAALADAVLHTWPLARLRCGRARQLLELLDAAVESHPHDLDLACSLHEAIASLAASLACESAFSDAHQRRALARLGLTYLHTLCSRFPTQRAFSHTLETLVKDGLGK